MKESIKVILLVSTFLLLITLSLHAQRYGSKLELKSPTNQELKSNAELLERRHNETKEKLDEITDGILDLRSKTNDRALDNWLKEWYEYFNSFYSKALAHESIRSQIYEGERKYKVALLEYHKNKEQSLNKKNESNEKIETKDDAISPYYKSFGSLFYEKPDLNSKRLDYPINNELIAVVRESVEDYNFFEVKTITNKYGFLPKETFEDVVIEQYSSSLYLKNRSNQKKLGTAFEMFKNFQYEQAYPILNELSNDDKPAALVYYLKGYIELFSIGNYKSSVNNYSRFIESGEQIPYFAFYERAIAYAQCNEFAYAIQDFTKCIGIAPNYLNAYFRRAILKSEMGDRLGAIKDYDYIISFKGKEKNDFKEMATVYNNKAYCLILLEKYSEAKPLVEKALELDKTKNYIWDTSGVLNYHLGLFSKSISDLNQALLLNETAGSYYYRGLAKISFNQQEEGCIDLSKAGEMGYTDAYEMIKKNCN